MRYAAGSHAENLDDLQGVLVSNRLRRIEGADFAACTRPVVAMLENHMHHTYNKGDSGVHADHSTGSDHSSRPTRVV